MTSVMAWILDMRGGRCWADDPMFAEGCRRTATTTAGLCRLHYIEILGREP